MKTYLQHEELWECIENPNNEPFDAMKDRKAKSKIILPVDSINYVHIQEAGTAKEVWENLSRAFDDSGLPRRVGLLRDLCTRYKIKLMMSGSGQFYSSGYLNIINH